MKQKITFTQTRILHLEIDTIEAQGRLTAETLANRGMVFPQHWNAKTVSDFTTQWTAKSKDFSKKGRK